MVDTVDKHLTCEAGIGLVALGGNINQEQATLDISRADKYSAETMESNVASSTSQDISVAELPSEHLDAKAPETSSATVDKSVRIVIVKSKSKLGSPKLSQTKPESVENENLETETDSKSMVQLKKTNLHSIRGSTIKLFSEETQQLISDTMDICPVIDSASDDDTSLRECVVCDKLFRFESRLLIHLKQHLALKGCECGFTNPCRDSVYRHQINCIINTRGRLIFEFDEENFDYFKNSVVLPGNDVGDFPRAIIDATEMCNKLTSSSSTRVVNSIKKAPIHSKVATTSDLDDTSDLEPVIPEASLTTSGKLVTQNCVFPKFSSTKSDKRKLPALRSRLKEIEERVSKLRKLADDLHSEAIDLKLKIADIELAND